MFEQGTIKKYQKKEILRYQREMDKLNAVLGGIKDMETLPQMAFVVDPKREEIAIKECRRLNIPIAAVVDTNCDPDLIDYVIPGNDDAIRAIKLFVSSVADACLEGTARLEETQPDAKEEPVVKVGAPAPEAEETKEYPASFNAEAEEDE